VVGACAVNDHYGLMLITSTGKIIRINTNEISIIGRNTKGVRLVNLDEGEKVAATAHLCESENGVENGNGTENGDSGDSNQEQEAGESSDSSE